MNEQPWEEPAMREPAQAQVDLGVQWWVLSPAAIRPNSVRAPVATTSARPLPACTTVPLSAQIGEKLGALMILDAD